MNDFDIKSVAIIGAGPAGLASIYELIHTNKDGTSTVGSEPSLDPRFEKVVAFEQKASAGGVWAANRRSCDIQFPPDSILKTQKYNNPDVLHPANKVPLELKDETFEKPLNLVSHDDLNYLRWSGNGVYNHLFTNIPWRFTRFSYMQNNKKYDDRNRTIYPFLTSNELIESINQFVDENELNKYIRFSSVVEKVSKTKEGKWSVIINREQNGLTEWYQETFDAVIIANGHYNVPYIPYIEGLADFSQLNPGATLHAKSYRSNEIFKGKRVLIVGGSISAANLLQYIFPLACRTIVSRKSPHLVFPWINEALSSSGILTKPTIKRINGATKEVTFSDGSIEVVDVILFTTGYHYHYPFLDTLLELVDPSNSSRVSGLFHQTFSIKDPTIATVGIAISGINFHTIEASAAAIAGVWSNSSKLPLALEQQKWEAERVQKLGNNYYSHYYPHNTVKEDFIDPLMQFAPKLRYNPLKMDGQYLHEVDASMPYLEALFYALKNKEIDISDTNS